MVPGLISYSIVILVGAALLIAARQWWICIRRKRPKLQATALGHQTLSLLFAIGALTLLLPPVYRAIGSVAGSPNIALLLADSLAVGFGWVVISYVAVTENPRNPARGLLGNVWLAAGVIGLMALLFARTPTDQAEPYRFIERFGTQPYVLEYTVVYMGWVGAIALRLMRISWRAWREAKTARQHAQLGLHTAAWGIGFAYTAHSCLHAVVRRFDLPYPLADPTVLTNGFLIVSILLNLNGLFLGGYRWAQSYRNHRLLYPLWRDIHALYPTIIAKSPFEAPRSELADILAVKAMRHRLERRVLEIQAGIVLLGSHWDPTAIKEAMRRCEAAGIDGEHAKAAADAVGFLATIHSGTHEIAPKRTAISTSVHETIDLDDELHHLRRVARAYHHSPIVTATLRERRRDFEHVA